MLVVDRALTGRPNAVVQALTTALVDGERIIGIACGDHIDICDANFNLRQSVLFSDAFPGAGSRSVSAVLLLGEGKLVAAADNDVAIWDRRSDRWQVHSSLQTTSLVTSLAYVNGPPTDILIVGNETLSLWAFDTRSRLPLWRRKWTGETYGPLKQVSLSSDGTLLTALARESPVVQIWAIAEDTVTLLPEAWHPTLVENTCWSPDSSALFTQTVDGTFRIWATMIDEPGFFVLWATINHTPFSGQPVCPRPLISYWVDSTFQGVATSDLADHLLTIFSDGSVGVTSIQNVGRVPPTCVEQHFHVTVPRAFTKRQLASLRYSSLSTDQSSHTLQIFGHSTNGTLIKVALSSLSARPKCVEARHRAARPIRALVSSKDGGIVWSLDEDGAITARATEDLASMGRVAIRHASLLCAWGDRFAITASGASLWLLQSDTVHVHVVGQFAAGHQFVDMQAFTSDEMTALSADGSVHLFRLTPSEIVRVQSSHSMPAPGSFRIVKHGVAMLDKTGCLTLPSGNQLKTHRQHHDVWSLSNDGHLALVAHKPHRPCVVTIWDTIESEFTTGLVYRLEMLENVLALRWLDAGEEADLLLVQSPLSLSVVTKSRRHYFDNSSSWSIWATISLANLVPYSLSAVTWRPDGTLVAAAGTALFKISHAGTHSLVKQVAAATAPLPLYHPQLLQQALLVGKSQAVDRILLLLAERFAKQQNLRSSDLDVQLFLSNDVDCLSGTSSCSRVQAQASVFLTNGIEDLSADTAEYNEKHLQTLCGALQGTHNPLGLDTGDACELAVLAQTAFEMKAHRRAIDLNGMRFLVALRALISTRGVRARRQQLHFRDVLWAYHSQTQEILLQAATTSFEGKMTWPEARSVGVFQWLRNSEALSQYMDFVARTTYNASENRDPIPCLIFYIALRKRRLVHGLWKQAVGHPDRNNMLRFLINDFDEPRWQTAARKNAFSLLSKQRFLLAASFFLLGDSLADAVNVCLRQLDDFPLAIAIARVYEGSDKGPVLRRILESHVAPLALGEGHRWLASWAFWMLNRRDLAIRVIVTPFADLLSSLPMSITKIGEPDTDDPALIMLLAELRDRSLQTLQGASYISGRTEFKVHLLTFLLRYRSLPLQFVLYIARILREMGCHVLALDLVQTWRFAPPTPLRKSLQRPFVDTEPVARPLARRRSSLLHRKQSSIVADIPSTVVSRAGSPEPLVPSAISTEDDEREAIRQLAASNRKKVVEVAAFNLDAFGF